MYLILSLIKKIKIKSHHVKDLLLLLSCILCLYFYLLIGHYKSIIDRMRKDQMRFMHESNSVRNLNETVDQYLKESLDEDFTLSSNDVYNLYRSSGMSNFREK